MGYFKFWIVGAVALGSEAGEIYRNADLPFCNELIMYFDFGNWNIDQDSIVAEVPNVAEVAKTSGIRDARSPRATGWLFLS